MTRTDLAFLRRALQMARRGLGHTSPNPAVGAVLVRQRRVIGRGWHRQAGAPHAEIEALADARARGHNPRGATLYVTLEPCCTHGRTPPCTGALLAAGIRRVVAAVTDPNPRHAGHGIDRLRSAGIRVDTLEETVATPPRSTALRRASERLLRDCVQLNEAFFHWIVHRTPWVTVKAAMTLDGKIATARGESKWITGPTARARAMAYRRQSDAILVGIETVLADDPALTVRPVTDSPRAGNPEPRPLLRIILDARARTPLSARVVTDAHRAQTTIVVGPTASRRRVAALARRVRVLVAPLVRNNSASRAPQIDLCWVLRRLGAEGVTSLLVEGGGEVHASFLLRGLAHRIAFFYAPMILGGRAARKTVAGAGVAGLADALRLTDLRWERLGSDLLLTARVIPPARRFRA